VVRTLAALGLLDTAHAQEVTALSLQTVTVTASGSSDMTAASAGDVSQEQIASQPLLRPAALLENVPGLIVTQHSGEGKANQYFLRAFNLDHGTDLALEVDDMPVNMPSHAHGQGYADLNFLIPELVSDLRYNKGPYYADEGDFATTVDAQLGFQSPHHWLVALDVFNVADVRWNDIEYYYVSRLRNEAAPAADYVVHPGVPRTLRARIQFWF